MSKENNERFIPSEHFGDTPATRRWLVLSICEVVKGKLYSRGNSNPSKEDIRDFVRKAKDKPFFWNQVLDQASKMRRREFGQLAEGFKNPDIPPRDAYKQAGKKIEEIFSEIDIDPERNCCFLDDLLLKDR
jgi:hypothetical protein